MFGEFQVNWHLIYLLERSQKKTHLIGGATSSEAFGFFTHLHKLVSLSRSTELMLQLVNKITVD